MNEISTFAADMKPLPFIVMMVMLFQFVFSQEKPILTTIDSSAIPYLINNPGSLLDKPIVVLPLSFLLTAANDQLPASLYYSFAGTPQSLSWKQTPSIDLTAPITLQLRDEEKDRPWKITLGAAQLGGVAYIAYKHIKKYGFK